MHDWKAKYNILEVMELLACCNTCPTLSNSKVIQLGKSSHVKNQLHFVVIDYVFFSACCHVICTCFIWLSIVSARTINDLKSTLYFLKKIMSELDILFHECECSIIPYLIMNIEKFESDGLIWLYAEEICSFGSLGLTTCLHLLWNTFPACLSITWQRCGRISVPKH